jgi:AcrR family transcriptional regulator
MPRQNADRRVVRTKAAIRKALLDLIAEKGFEALTVRDITTRADINRGTFYLHYQDKYDLLQQTEAQVIADLEQLTEQPGAFNVPDPTNLSEPVPFLLDLFEYLQTNAALMAAVLGLRGAQAFQAYIRQSIQNDFLKKRGVYALVRLERLTVPLEYLVSYVAAAHFGVFQTWLQGGCRESPHEMALILTRLSVTGTVAAGGIGHLDGSRVRSC